MSDVLFNRCATLTLSKPRTGQVRGGRFGAFFGEAPNGVVIGGNDLSDALRFTFKIEKKLEKSPNTADIAVFNLSERSRAEFQTKPLHVRLDVGYQNEVQRLFVGDMRWAHSLRGSADWETQLQVGDGERAYRHARVNRSFRGGVTARAAIYETVTAMGLDVPSSLNDLPNLDRQYAAGLSLEGPAHRVLSQLLDPYGAEWSIQDGRLQVLRDVDIRKDQAILFNQATGLIGTPEYGPPKEKGKPPVLSFKTLLYPGMTPGGLIRIESRAVTGLFKLIRVLHEGDTHGPTWYSSCEAKAR